jgi:hypothetical protein
MARKHAISRWAEDDIGIAIFAGGALVDPVPQAVAVVVRDAAGAAIQSGAATRDGVGLYSFRLTVASTKELGQFTAAWSYTLDGNPREFTTDFEVVPPQVFWDALTPEEKQLVDNVYHRVSDNFDSELGGPYLWEVPQATFGFETIARLMTTDALPYVNFSKFPPFQPPFTVGVPANGGKPFPAGWYGVLEKATHWSVLKHLSRSYIEIPVAEGVNVARLDRSPYRDRWREEARDEKEELDRMLGQLKRQYMFGVRSRSLLLAGGFFPMAYLDPARPRWPYVVARW